MKSYFALFVIAILSLIGCRNSADTVPFPQNETGTSQPKTKAFTFGKPSTIEWKAVEGIEPLQVKKFDFEKLPTIPFNIGTPSPIPKPFEEKPFDLNGLPDTVFNLSTLPTQKLKFKTILAGNPRVVKAGFPAPKQDAARGIFTANTNLGFAGNARVFLQDASGILWVGTDKGLCKYDGVNVEIYAAEQGISNPNISSIYRDRTGRIWFGSVAGDAYVFDPASHLIHEVIDRFPGEDPNRGNIYSIIEDTNGQILFTRLNHGLVVINEAEQTVKHFGVNEGMIEDWNVTVTADNQGMIWVTSEAGVTIIDPINGKIRKLSPMQGLHENRMVDIIQDSDGEIWIGGSGGASIINLDRKTIRHLGLNQGLTDINIVAGLFEDKDGTIWLGTSGSATFAFDKKLNLIEKIHVGFGEEVIYHFLEDSEGQLWMGTVGTGSYLLKRKFGRLGSFTMANGLSSNSVWSVLEAQDGNIWLGTYGGVDIYNPATKTLKKLRTENGLINNRATGLLQDKKGHIWACGNDNGISIIDTKAGTIKQLGAKQGLDIGIKELFEDSQGQIWLGSSEGLIFVYDPDKNSLKQMANLEFWKESFVNTMIQDKAGKIWISSFNNEAPLSGGVLIIDIQANTMKRLTTEQGLSNNLATSLLEDSKGNIWIGTEKGLDMINPDNNQITTFTTLEGLGNDPTFTVAEVDGKIYTGTSNGLSIITPPTSPQSGWNIMTLQRTQGLPVLDFNENGEVYTSTGQYWAGVEDQILMVMDKPKEDTLTISPHVTSINILDRVHLFQDKKTLSKNIATIDTIWKADLRSVYENKVLPTNNYLDENKIEWDSTEHNYNVPVNLRLPHHQNYLSFTFATPNLSSPDKVKYRYILEGIDKNWGPISAYPFSENYRDLPSGKYIFKVASIGMNGKWSSPAEFVFTILPPWWLSWWAYTIYVLAFAGLVRGYISFRSASLKKQNLLLEEKVALRTNQLQKSLSDLQETQKQLIQSEKMASLGELTAGIAHEIQNPLNFVNNFAEVNSELIAEMKAEIAKGNLEEVKDLADDIDENEKKIMFHGKRADGIVKGMLQHSRSSSGVKEPTDINVLADEYLRLAYHGLRAKDKSFNASMKTNFDETLGKIDLVPQDIGRVILNLITNAFYVVAEKKQSLNGTYEPTVTVSTKNMGDKVLISVKDNGNGIPQRVLDKIFQPFFTTKPAGLGTGLGLSMSYDIVTQAHHGEIKVETKEGEGTEFIVVLPK